MIAAIREATQPMRLTLFGHEVRFGITAVAMDLVYAWVVFQAGQPLWYIATFVVVLHVSVLVHELGHALMLRAMGCSHATIGLHALGGHTAPCDMHAYVLTKQSKWRWFLVAGAGPAAGLILAGVSFLLATMATTQLMLIITMQAFMVNLVLNLMNLLPVFPLDGGHMVKSLIEFLLPDKLGKVAAFMLYLGSGLVALVGGYYSYQYSDPFSGVTVLFVLAANVAFSVSLISGKPIS